MESPAALLKSAAFEEDAHQRTDKVIKACKIITDLLPYDKKTQVLIEEQDLMKYLMLTLPLNPRAVDLIIITMMDKFKKVNYFLKETWAGFLAIAQMEEGEAGEKKKLDDPLKLLGLGIKSILKFSLTKEMDDLGMSLKPIYNQQITAKRDSIKLTVLGYVEKFLVTYITELRTVTAFKPDIADLTKKFIAYTTNETIVNKTAAMIEKLKGLDPELDLDNDVEEAMLSKKDPQSRSNTSRTNLEESKHEKAKNAKKKSRTSAEIASVTNTQSIFQRNKKPGELEEVEENKSSEEDISEEAEEEENETEPPGTVAFDSAEGSTELEEWLSDGKITDIPLISKSEFAQEFIQDETNFDIIFGYLFDPRTQPVSDCWKQRHPYMSNFPYEKEKPLPLHPNQKEALAIAKLKEYKQLHPYALRSFKTIQMLCDDRNYREILDSSSLFIGRFFQELHKNLTTKDDLICNLNHVVAVMEYFLIKEPVLCMTYILHYNLIYKLFQNIELYSVQRILLTLFNCCPNTHDIGHDLYWKVLDYCKFTSIFADMSKAVLDGEKTFPKDKFKVEYKPEGMKDLVDIARDSLQLSNNPVENWSFTHDRSPNFILEDSKGGFGLDIDLIADELQKSRPINKKDLIKKNKSPPRTASKLNLKRYPSLAEKHYYDEPEGLANSSTAVKASEYADTVIETQKGTGKSGGGKAERQSPSVADSSNRTSPSKINLDTSTTKVSDQKTSSTKGTPAKVSIVSPSKTTPANATPSKVGTVTSPNKASTATPTKVTVTSASKTNVTSPPPQKPAILIKEDVKITSPAPKEQPAAKPVPSQTALKEQSTPKQVTPVQTPAPKDLTLLNPRKVEDEKLDDKTQETRPSVANLLKKDISIPDAPTKKSIGTLTRITDKPERTEPAPPEKKSWAKEFDMEVLGKKELEHLNELYPTSTKNMSPTALDREAKKPEYKMKNIRAIDQFSLDMCEFFDLLFQKMIMNSDGTQPFQVPTDIPNLKTDDYTISLYRLKRRLGASTVNQEKFWKAVFVNKGEFFRNILTNYLIKIKIHHFDEMNSGYASGILVNSILTHCMTFDAMQPYANDIQNISRENFPFLCKTLIQSTAWVNRPLKVYLQDYEVQEPLGTGRLALAKTLSLIILNDGGNNYDILNQMNDTCWHTLIIWFFTKRTNGLYHQIFYSIIQIAFLHTNEKTILNILFKLNLLSYLYKTWNEIYQNNVLLKENHVESVFCYLKKFTQLIEHTIKTHEHYTTLAEQIETSVSWGALKSKLLYRAKEKKKTGNTDKNKPKSKGHGPLGTPSKGTRQDFLNTTATSIRSQQGSSPVPGQKGDSPTNASGKKILGK